MKKGLLMKKNILVNSGDSIPIGNSYYRNNT